MAISLAVLFVMTGAGVLFDIGGFIQRRCAQVQSKAADRRREMQWSHGRLETPYVPTLNARPGVIRALGLPILVVGALLLLLHLD
ncbi:hypothetical protein HEP86_01695 [Streptomyces sp. RPA4-5]|uniref:hypothetical protein n=1 Tax=Streptomyces sp. RPA4-5 TaxID=2721245 RepID=UPI00143E9CE3|nr:hypothetical protein [Streptomyces sp. RPA4-5]QIY53453.1 hypothetical protein HEP86_01695 [Streptomyces sp. RPA4-5]